MKKSEKLAYIAGIIDGEGSLMIHKIKRNTQNGLSYRIIVSVEMCSKCVIEMLFKEFGGSITKRRRDNRKKSYTWRVSGIKAKNVIVQLAPFIMEKKKQSNLLIKFQTEILSNWKRGFKLNKKDLKIREEYYLKNKLLNGYRNHLPRIFPADI